MQQTTSHLKRGTLLKKGKYTILHKLSSGGFGITYKATYTKKVAANASAIVAIKELFISGNCVRNTTDTSIALQDMDSHDFSEFKGRFLREAKTLQKLNKVKQVVNVIDYFEENNTAYMVMEFIEGKTLKDHVREKGYLSQAHAIKYLNQIAHGLKEIHKHQIIHRDIKPSNIIINNQDQAVLIDFGTAKGFIAGKTTLHSMIFTPNYAAPEQFSQHKKIGPFTDIYALGGTLYYCLTGKEPLSIHDRDPKERIIIRGISIAVENLLNKMLRFQASQRPQSANAILYAIHALNSSKTTNNKATYKTEPKAKVAYPKTIFAETKHLEPNVKQGKEAKKQKSYLKNLGATTTNKRYLLINLVLMSCYLLAMFAPLIILPETISDGKQVYTGWGILESIFSAKGISEFLMFFNVSLIIILPFSFLLYFTKKWKRLITIIGAFYAACIVPLLFVFYTSGIFEWGAILLGMINLAIVVLFLEIIISPRISKLWRGFYRIALIAGFLFLGKQFVFQASDIIQLTWSGIQINNRTQLLGSLSTNFDVRSTTSLPDANYIITSGSYITMLDTEKDSVRWKNNVQGSMQTLISPDQKQLIALDSDNLQDEKHTLKFFDLANGNLLDEINIGKHFIRAMAMDTVKNTLALGGFDKRITIVDLKTKRTRKTLTAKNLHNVLHLEFNGKGDKLVSGHTRNSGTNTLYLWDVKTGKIINEFNLKESVTDVKMSPDDTIVAAATKVGIYLFDMESGELLRTLTENKVGFKSIDFHPSKPLLASVGQKESNELNFIHIWNPLTGVLIRSIDKSGTAALRAVSFKNEKELITSNYLGKTTIWQLNIFKN